MANRPSYLRLHLILILALIPLGCASTSASDASPFVRTRHALVIAHRGGALEAPENTLAAIAHAAKSGATWAEIDVHLSADGVPVLMHDHTCDRTTSGKGAVADTSLADLRLLTAGRPRFALDAVARITAENQLVPEFGDRFANETIPTLDEAIAVARVHLMIELKSPARPDARLALVEAVVARIRAHRAVSRVAIASFDMGLLAHARELAPEIPRIGLVDNAKNLAPMLALEVSVLAAWHGLAKEALALRDAARAGSSAANSANAPAIWAWTIYSPSRAAELDALGVDGIITDAPGAVAHALSQPTLLPVPGS
jgi:glycerophosphoryl diester phosphodiesterase